MEGKEITLKTIFDTMNSTENSTQTSIIITFISSS